MCGAWATTHPDASQLFEATAGTMQRAPLADVLFQIIFSTALCGLRVRLDREGLIPSWSPDARTKLATWADDLSVPIATEAALDLIAVAARTAVHAQAALASVNRL